MPTETSDVCPLEEVGPRCPESRRYFEDSLAATRLLAPPSENTHGLVVERDVTRLAALRIPALYRDELMRVVNQCPSQFEELAASKSGVHRQEYGRRQVISEVRQGRKQRPVT